MRRASATGISTISSPTCSRCDRCRPLRRKAATMKIARLVTIGFWLAAASASAQVTPERLVNAAREPQQWLMYSGAYDGSRFSPLDQINRTNVPRLSLQWVFQTGVRGRYETTPIVIDGVM